MERVGFNIRFEKFGGAGAAKWISVDHLQVEERFLLVNQIQNMQGYELRGTPVFKPFARKYSNSMIHTLPPELIRHILSFLAEERSFWFDILCVCKLFNEIGKVLFYYCSVPLFLSTIHRGEVIIQHIHNSLWIYPLCCSPRFPNNWSILSRTEDSSGMLR